MRGAWQPPMGSVYRSPRRSKTSVRPSGETSTLIHVPCETVNATDRVDAVDAECQTSATTAMVNTVVRALSLMMSADCFFEQASPVVTKDLVHAAGRVTAVFQGSRDRLHASGMIQLRDEERPAE